MLWEALVSQLVSEQLSVFSHSPHVTVSGEEAKAKTWIPFAVFISQTYRLGLCYISRTALWWAGLGQGPSACTGLLLLGVARGRE